MDDAELSAGLARQLDAVLSGILSKSFGEVDRDLAEVQRTLERAIPDDHRHELSPLIRRAIANWRFNAAMLKELQPEAVTTFFEAFRSIGFYDQIDECLATIGLARYLIEHGDFDKHEVSWLRFARIDAVPRTRNLRKRSLACSSR